MSKLKKLEAKKLLKELEFFESDLEYKKEVICEADGEFLNSVNNFLKNHPKLKELYDKKINDKIDQIIKKKKDEFRDIKIIKDDSEGIGGENVEEEKDSIEENIEDNKYQKSPKSTKLKKLYREIVKLTHPDKVSNNKLNTLYIKATSLYDKNDLAGIYAICNELNIDYEIDDEDNHLISDKINNLKQKIGFMESTFTWKWVYSASQKEKDNIILTFIKMQLS
jgi:gas vesicle protein